jgi:Ala-tRNA(Pro) deacylase
VPRSGTIHGKTVIVKIDGRLAMAVVAAPKDVNLEALREQSGAADVMLAAEEDFIDRFAGCQLGTVPPFGNLFGVQTFLDRDLARRNQIAFPAGTHVQVIAISLSDYLRLVKPTKVRISAAAVPRSCHAALSL